LPPILASSHFLAPNFLAMVFSSPNSDVDGYAHGHCSPEIRALLIM